ncbi:MAG: hypothetical protein OHK0038_08200 [Flammeovirgaceae bacterium]
MEKDIQDDNDYMIIPVYKLVFRYLMEETETAMLVISTLINRKNLENIIFCQISQ